MPRKSRKGGAKQGWGTAAGAPQPAAASSHQAGASGDSKYMRLTRDIDGNMRLLTKAISAVESSSAQIGTSRDSVNMRKDTIKRVDDARGLLAKLLGQIKDELGACIAAEAASGGGTARKQQRDKYARLAKQHGTRLGKVASAFSAANKKTPPPKDAKGAAAARMPASAAASGRDEEAALIGGTEQSAQDMVDATHSALLREREQETAEIAREMTEVADIMNDIAQLTEEQNDGFVRLETNAGVAEAEATAGNRHLEAASKQQASYRKKLLIFVAVIVLAAAGITLYFVVGRK